MGMTLVRQGCMPSRENILQFPQLMRIKKNSMPVKSSTDAYKNKFYGHRFVVFGLRVDARAHSAALSTVLKNTHSPKQMKIILPLQVVV